MSTSLSSVGNQIIIYCGAPMFIAGVLRGLINIIVFLSLRTFRQNSCAFYLIVMSIVNIGQLFTGLLSRIMATLFAADGTETSLFYCKFRPFMFHVCIETSLTCLCLATIDQYFATSSHPRWRQICNIKLARRIIVISVIIWMLHGIPYIMLYNHVVSSTTNTVSCNSTNFIFSQYRNYVNLLALSGVVPITVAATFGLLAYHNVQQLIYSTVPFVRRQLDKQLTVMELVKVVVNIFTLLPYTIVNALSTNTVITRHPSVQVNIEFTTTITLVIYYIYFASPFYIYICASERFRRQLIYVLFTSHANRWKQRRMTINQVTPET